MLKSRGPETDLVAHQIAQQKAIKEFQKQESEIVCSLSNSKTSSHNISESNAVSLRRSRYEGMVESTANIKINCVILTLRADQKGHKTKLSDWRL